MVVGATTQAAAARLFFNFFYQILIGV